MRILLGGKPLLKAQIALLLLTLLAKISIVSVAAEMTSDHHMRQATVSVARIYLLNEDATDSADAAANVRAKNSLVHEQSRKSQRERPVGTESAKAQFEETGSLALYVSENLHGTNISFTNISSSYLANRRRRKHVHNERLRRQTFPGWTAENTADRGNGLQASDIFGIPWTMIGESLYKVIPPASWTDVQQTCRTMNAFLADIGSQSEETITSDFLSMQGRTRVWIGLNDRQTEDQWMWDSGHHISYRKWIIYQPNNYKGMEHCGEFHAHNPSGFNDNKCSALLPGLCMRTGSRCGDAIIGSGTIRYPTFSANYAGNRSCTWTIQAAPGAAGISLQIGHVLMDTCCDFLHISNIFGVQLALTGVQKPQNITLESPATITFATNSSVTGKGFTITFRSIQNYTELCGSGWTMKRGSCYKLTPAMAWSDAQHTCRHSMKGFLADIGSEAQETAIYEFLDTHEIARTWIGLKDTESKGQWDWDSGRAVTYLNWNHGQPGVAVIGEDCVELNALDRAGFSKSDCRTHFPGLCKRTGRTCNGAISGSGVIRSPGFPESYASNLDCVWTIQADPGASEVLLQVLHMTTETCCDYVHISDASGFQISLSGVQEPQNITLRSPATVSFATDYSGESEGFAIAVSSFPNHNVPTESTRVVSIAVITALSTIMPICVILILVFICWKRKISFFKEATFFASSQVQSSTSGVQGGGQPQSSRARASEAPMAMANLDSYYQGTLSQQADSYDVISCVYESLGVDVTEHTYLRSDGAPSFVKVAQSTEIP